MFRRLLPTIALAVVLFPSSTSAQDVEMLGRRYGKRPPDAYYREMARDPDAFRFQHGRALRMREEAELRRSRAGFRDAGGGAARVGPAGAGSTGPATVGLGPRDEPVVGDIYIPVLLGLFSDSPVTPPVTTADVQNGYFGAQPGTVAEYYAEVSSDSITLHGDVQSWVRSSMTQAQATEGISGLGCCGIGDFIKSLLDLQGMGVDWGAYDNDGPDGVPNSGDDDGYVDALAVIQPTPGAECPGDWPDRVWSHKWSLSSASSGSYYVTATPSNASGVPFIRVDDYFVQGAVKCGTVTDLNDIGVFTHETGHAFGLPDLYDTRSFGGHEGAGSWELMAAGTYGCSGTTPASPCHMGAWSKAMLGWVTVDTLPPDTDLGTLTLPPVETSGLVYRVDAADGSGEYFLLENRQRLGYDGGPGHGPGLWSPGLLIWQIDQQAVDTRWTPNTVNSFNHMGVWLRQADGLDNLGQVGGNRGDAGDPFPGQTVNTAFHAASSPAATSYQGSATGLTVVGIGLAGSDVDMHVLTRFSTLTVTSSGTSGGATGLFLVDGATLPDPPANLVVSAPFVPVTVEAAAGEIVSPGVRTSFSQWDDAPEPRSRVIVTPLADAAYNASYAGTEYELHVDLTGGVNGVEPGTISTSPVATDLWFSPATDVTVTATAQTGFSFLDWTGALAGQTNPASVTMSAPVVAGADFELIYGVSDTVVDLVATLPVAIQLQAVNGTAPVAWSLVNGPPPTGVSVLADGSVSGVPLDLGAFPLVIEATDALGLTATAGLTLDVAGPTIPVGQLGSSFLLGGPPLDSIQALFLDRQGNVNGVYDLGDFRAWLLANPSLPLSAALSPKREEAVITVPVRLRDPEGER